MLAAILPVACGGQSGVEDQSSTVATSSASSTNGQVPPVLASYTCDGTTTPLTGMFYNDRRPAELVLTWGLQTVRLARQPMGSGIRYVGDGVEYDEHQGSVHVDFKGTQLNCTPIQPATASRNQS
jgi:uncharacterized protein